MSQPSLAVTPKTEFPEPQSCQPSSTTQYIKVEKEELVEEPDFASLAEAYQADSKLKSAPKEETDIFVTVGIEPSTSLIESPIDFRSNCGKSLHPGEVLAYDDDCCMSANEKFTRYQLQSEKAGSFVTSADWFAPEVPCASIVETDLEIEAPIAAGLDYTTVLPLAVPVNNLDDVAEMETQNEGGLDPATIPPLAAMNNLDEIELGNMGRFIGEDVSVKKALTSSPEADRRIQRNSGHEYVNRKGTVVKGRKCRFVECNCPFRCTLNMLMEERQEVFEKYWASKSWLVQSQFISQTVLVAGVKRRTTSSEKKAKSFSRQYFLNGRRVCKATYMSTLDINSARINYVINRKAKCGMISPDKRGEMTPNKTPESSIISVKSFLEQFPKYRSHYTSSKLYFHPSLTLKKLYELYTEAYSEQKTVSLKIFTRVFKDFNVAIYIPKKDTCQQCDKLEIEIKAATNASIVEELKAKKSAHHFVAELGREKLCGETEKSKLDPSRLVFTFDLQQIQPIPFIQTSVYYYKRKMWLYNLGINTRNDNAGHMNIWTEVEGKRGSREICSCISNFLDSIDTTRIKNIVSFSDCCPGQKRNGTFITFMAYTCKQMQVSWEHNFMESGHSYLPNDTDFGKIESKKKQIKRIYTVEEWEDLIANASRKKPFKILRLKDKFKNYDKLTSCFSFKAKDEEPDFRISEIKQVFIEASRPEEISYKSSHDPSAPIRQVQLVKKRGVQDLLNFENCYPKGLKLSWEKYSDLISLLDYLPPNCHQYYQNLPHQAKKGQTSQQPEDLPDSFSDI